MVYISEDNLQEFVSDDGATVRKAKQRVVSEDSLYTECAGMQDPLMAQGAECLVCERKRSIMPSIDRLIGNLNLSHPTCFLCIHTTMIAEWTLRDMQYRYIRQWVLQCW